MKWNHLDLKIMCHLLVREMGFNELVRLTGPRSSLYRRLKRLRERGLVGKRPGWRGRWYLTKEGRKYLLSNPDALESLKSFIPMAFRGLSPLATVALSIQLTVFLLNAYLEEVSILGRPVEAKEVLEWMAPLVTEMIRGAKELKRRVEGRREEELEVLLLTKSLWRPLIKYSLEEIASYLEGKGSTGSFRKVAKEVLREVRKRFEHDHDNDNLK